MNPRHADNMRCGGSTLVEAVVAIGVLAVVVPVVFGALAESGNSGLASQAETRSAWIIPACLDEIRGSREGRPRYFTPTVAGQQFPPDGEVWALAFAADGTPVGKLPTQQYQQGVRELNGARIRYIASMKSAKLPAGSAPMMRVDISLEYPAVRSSTKRDKLDFHTRIP